MSESNEKENDQVIRNISPTEACEMVKKLRDDPNFVILDVRTPKEFSDGHIEGALNLDFYDEDFQEQIENGDKEKKYLICCGSGVRGVKTARNMENVGYSEVYNILGGISVWKKSRLPLTED
jgi:rhodanese-related sulfurtransferase